MSTLWLGEHAGGGINMWIARNDKIQRNDKTGKLYLFIEKPERIKKGTYWYGTGLVLPDKDYPEYAELKWEDEPVEVKIVPANAMYFTPPLETHIKTETVIFTARENRKCPTCDIKAKGLNPGHIKCIRCVDSKTPGSCSGWVGKERLCSKCAVQTSCGIFGKEKYCKGIKEKTCDNCNSERKEKNCAAAMGRKEINRQKAADCCYWEPKGQRETEIKNEPVKITDRIVPIMDGAGNIIDLTEHKVRIGRPELGEIIIEKPVPDKPLCDKCGGTGEVCKKCGKAKHVCLYHPGHVWVCGACPACSSDPKPAKSDQKKTIDGSDSHC